MRFLNGGAGEGTPGDLVLVATTGRLAKLRSITAPLIERGYKAAEVDDPQKLPDVAQFCTQKHVIVIADFRSIIGEMCDPGDPDAYGQSYKEFLLGPYARLRGFLRSQSQNCDLVIVYRRPYMPFVGLGDYVSGKAEEESGYLPSLVEWLERLASKPKQDDDPTGRRWIV